MRRMDAVRAALALVITGFASLAMADWQLLHEEDFSRATALDPAWWRLETGFLRNRENQFYQPANVFVRDGMLTLEARREAVANPAYTPGSSDWRRARPVSEYTSGSMVSHDPMLYGRIEIVARTPSGAGVWPAIWLLHESAEVYGEIDLFEAVGKHKDTVFQGVHFGRDPRTRKHSNTSRVWKGFEGTWHTHTLEWTPERIAISIDGEPVFAFDPGDAATGGLDPLRRPMRLRINLALGGSWGGRIDESSLPARFDVRSIRVWRWLASKSEAAKAEAQEAEAPKAEAPRPEEPAVTRPRWGR